MAKKKLIDVKQLGQMFFEKGERLGLAISAVIMLLLIGLGVMAASMAKDWAGPLKRAAENGIASFELPKPPADLKEKTNKKVPINWPLQAAADIPSQVGWQAIDERNDNKRRKPYALPIIARLGEDGRLMASEIQMDYMIGARFGNDIDLIKYTATGYVPPNAKAPTSPIRTPFPGRMLVVSAAFPYTDQLKVFQQELRFPDAAALRASPDDLPKFLGLVVSRTEMLPDGKGGWTSGPQVAIYRYDEAKEKTIVAAHLDMVFRESIYQTVPPELRKFVRAGLVTPLPEMAVGIYPKLDLPTIKADAVGPGGTIVQAGGGNKNPAAFPMFPQPMGNQPTVQPQGQFVPIPWETLPKPLQEKFAGKQNPFDPFGGGDPGKAGAFPMHTERPQVVEQPPMPGGEEPPADNKLLVRFFDVDVQPGKTYSYKIEVRLHNPNLGKTTVVASLDYASIKEFRSPPVDTPNITIPRDYDFYAIDLDPKKLESEAFGNDRKSGATADKVAVQIHRWTDKSVDRNLVGDFAIAERLLVRKGEPIGRPEVFAEVPEWMASSERFEIRTTQVTPAFGKPIEKPGIKVDFTMGNPAPILVDFEGGNRDQAFLGYEDRRIPKSELKGMADEAETELLVLTPEGKLIIRRSIVDKDPSTPRGQERQLRYNQWRDRLRQLRGAGGDAAKKGPFPG